MFDLSPHDGRFMRPYAEATGSTTVNTNSFTGANLTASAQDNGAITCGSALIDLTGDVINLKRAGLWAVTTTVAWGADASANGYRRIELALNFLGGTFGGEMWNNSIGAQTQSTSALINVSNNTGYGVFTTMYHNSSSASISTTITMRAVWLAPYHA